MRETDTLSAQQEQTKSDASAANPLREQTLKLAGHSYILGDIALSAAGFIRSLAENQALPKSEQKSWHKLLGGTAGGAAIWLAGGVAAARYGNPDTETQLKIQASKLENYLRQKGIAIPDDARAQSKLLKKKSFWEQCEQFLYEHPSEMLNGAYAIGSAFMIQEGVKHIRNGTKTLLPFGPKGFNGMTTGFWMGSLVMLGALVGLLAKEDPEAKKKAEHGNFFEKAIAFVTEKPLRVSALAYTTNNLFLAASVKQDFDVRATTYAGKNFKPHYFSAVTLASYLFANAMLMMSNRDQITKNGFDESSLAELERAAASIVAAQPPELQKAILEDVSTYMAQQKGIKLDAVTLAQHIAQRAGEVTNERLQQTAATMKWSERAASREELPQTPAK